MDAYKRCPECSKWHEARKFYKDSTKPDGLSAWCKSCMNCGVTVERAVYGNGERQWGDPSEEQITAACLRLQASWTPAVRESRRKARAAR